MTQKEDNPSEKIAKSAPPGVGAKLVSFLDSKLGMFLVVTIVGILGLFTWQREDWRYKQQFYRHQLLIDRRVELIEQVNTDVGHFIANADTAVAAIEKQVPSDQRVEVIEAYNIQQKLWIAAHHAHAVLLGFYFPTNVTDKFAEIVRATEDYDRQLYLLGRADKESSSRVARDARQVSTEVGGLIQELNNLVKQELYKPQSEVNEV